MKTELLGTSCSVSPEYRCHLGKHTAVPCLGAFPYGNAKDWLLLPGEFLKSSLKYVFKPPTLLSGKF